MDGVSGSAVARTRKASGQLPFSRSGTSSGSSGSADSFRSRRKAATASMGEAPLVAVEKT